MFSNEEIAEMLFEPRIANKLLTAIYDGLSIVEAPEELPELETASFHEIVEADPDRDTYYCQRVEL
jgi:hypothetical protein